MRVVVVDAAAGPAVRRVWTVFWVTLIGAGAGAAWDGWWHTHIAFGGFFMPPHLLIYGSVAVAAFLVLRLLRDTWLHPAFRRGGSVLLPGIARPLPGGLLALALPFVVLGIAGAADATWHTAFGLDETRWSFPHNLLGWGLALFVLGVLTARLAVDTRRPSLWATVPLGWFGLLLAGPFLGPVGEFANVDHAVAVSRIPTLAADPNAQAALRVVIEHGLTGSNPLMLLLGPLWLGLGVALLHRVDPRPRFLVLVAVLFTLLGTGGSKDLDRYVSGLSEQPAYWLPKPVLPFVLTYLAVRFLARRREASAWAAAGAVAAVCWVVGVGMPAWSWLLVPAAAVAAVLGARLGTAGGALVERPTGRRLAALLGVVLLAGALAGITDLVLRTITP